MSGSKSCPKYCNGRPGGADGVIPYKDGTSKCLRCGRFLPLPKAAPAPAPKEAA